MLFCYALLEKACEKCILLYSNVTLLDREKPYIALVGPCRNLLSKSIILGDFSILLLRLSWQIN